MRRFLLGVSAATLSTWLALVGCGGSGNEPGSSGSAGEAAGTDAGGASSAGKGSGGSATAGSSASAGDSSGGSTQAGSSNPGGTGQGAAGSPEPGGDGGSPSSGDGKLVSCDPRGALCELLPGECPPMQVREVVGTCWGDCVKIERCACGAADDCPNDNEYTCWMGRHCGPYVK